MHKIGMLSLRKMIVQNLFTAIESTLVYSHSSYSHGKNTLSVTIN